MNTYNVSKGFLMLVIALALISQAYALGIAPSHTDIIFEPNLEKTINLKIINSGNETFKALVYAEGDLADYVSISNAVLEFKENEESKKISYTIKLPKELNRSGKSETRIVVRQMQEETAGIKAKVAVASKLNIIVPYSGKYVETRLIAPPFEQNKESNFAVEITNLGTEYVLSAHVVLDIYTPLNEKIETLISKEFSLDSKEEKVIPINWTPTILPGEYFAKITIIYDGLNAFAEKPFSIGKAELEILGISVDNFKLGGIARFDIFVKNNWNEDMNTVYAEAVIKDKNKIYATTKTASADLGPYEEQKLLAYWDTAKVIPDNYQLYIVLNYLGKTKEESFNINVDYESIEVTKILGKAAASPKQGKSEFAVLIYILTIAVVVLIINLLIYFKLIRKKKPPVQISPIAISGSTQ